MVRVFDIFSVTPVLSLFSCCMYVIISCGCCAENILGNIICFVCFCDHFSTLRWRRWIRASWKTICLSCAAHTMVTKGAGASAILVATLLSQNTPVSAPEYRKTSNIRRTLVGNKIVNHSDVVGASPVGAAPTTSSFSTWHLASRDSAKTAARQKENILNVGIWCNLY